MKVQEIGKQYQYIRERNNTYKPQEKKNSMFAELLQAELAQGNEIPDNREENVNLMVENGQRSGLHEAAATGVLIWMYGGRRKVL